MRILLLMTVVLMGTVTQSAAGVVVTKKKKVSFGALKKSGNSLNLTIKTGSSVGRMKYKLPLVEWYSLNPKVDSYYKASRQAYKDGNNAVANFLLELSLKNESETTQKAEEFKRYMAAMQNEEKVAVKEKEEKDEPKQKAHANYADIEGNLIIAEGKSTVSFSDKKIKSCNYYLLYYSASWCPPCRAFTPNLIKTYNTLKATNGDNFEIILIGRDNSNSSYKRYMTDYKMPWPALKYSKVKNSELDKYKGSGIPFLALVDADGNAVSQGQYNVLEDLTQLLQNE